MAQINEYKSNGPSNAQQISESADRLSDWFGQRLNQKAAQEAELNKETQMAKLKDLIGAEGNKRNLALAKDSLKSGDLPQGSGISIGENGNIGITKGVNPNQAQSQDDRIISKEAGNLQSNFSKDAQSSIEGLKHTNLTREMVKNNSFAAMGPEQIQFVKGIVGQRLAAQEIPQGASRTKRAEFLQRLAGWTGNTNAPILSPEEQRDIMKVTDQMANEYSRGVGSSLSKTRAMAPALAPRSFRTGQHEQSLAALENYAKSMGYNPDWEKQATPRTEQIGAAPQPQAQYGGVSGAIMGGLKSLFQKSPPVLGNAQQSVAAPQEESLEQMAARRKAALGQ